MAGGFVSVLPQQQSVSFRTTRRHQRHILSRGLPAPKIALLPLLDSSDVPLALDGLTHMPTTTSSTMNMSTLNNSASILTGISLAFSVASLLLSLRSWRLLQNSEDSTAPSSSKSITSKDDESIPHHKRKSKSKTKAKSRQSNENTLDNQEEATNNTPGRIRATLENQILSQQDGLTMQPIGVVRSIYRLCVGTPRQGLLAPHARGRIELTLPKDAAMDSVQELETFSHIWIVFVFHLNTLGKKGQVSPKIAPPALGGLKVGVFATRSPHRFNPIGITLAKLDRIEIRPKNSHKHKKKAPRVILHISGLDLVDGTPVLDVKPYVPIYDSVPPPLVENQQYAMNSNGDIDNSHVRLPPWVSEGLATRRHVTISNEAEENLRHILATPVPTNNKRRTKSALEFYGRNEEPLEQTLQEVMACIEEVLAMDVRSSFQTKKAREGKYQAERAHRIQDRHGKNSNNNNDRGFKDVPLQTTATNAIDKKGDETDMACTQQLDNLLLHFTVTEASQVQRTTSEGSGAEDQVLVTRIEHLL